MKFSSIFVSFLLLGSFSRADGPPADAPGPIPVPYDKAHRQEFLQIGMQMWLPFALKHNSVPDLPVYLFDARTEHEFILRFRDVAANLASSRQFATGPMAEEFLVNAGNAFRGCGIDEEMQQKYPKQFSYFDENFYSTHIVSVPFNLCQNSDSSDCSFKTSFAAKNFPELKLILINAYKWNMLGLNQRSQLAVHEFLGVVGIEKSTYGMSSTLDLATLTARTTSGYNESTYCIQLK